jgi:anthranilate phosphoribosyltransferase
LNSAAGLYCAGKASSLADGVELAAKLIDDGAAMSVLDRYKVASNQ